MVHPEGVSHKGKGQIAQIEAPS